MSFMLRCREVARNVSAIRDGQLRGWARMATFLHLALCGACRGYAQDVDRIHYALKSISHKGVDDGLSAAAKQRLLDHVDRNDPEA